MNLSAIIVLLNVVLALISNPNLPAASRQNAFALASQAVAVATNALQQQAVNHTPTSTPSAAPAQSVGVGTDSGTPDITLQPDQINPPVVTPVATTTVPTSTPQQTPLVTPTSSAPVQPTVKTIPVSFVAKSDTEAWITIKNTLAETIIIKNLIVPSSTLTGYAIDQPNPPKFTPVPTNPYGVPYQITLWQGDVAVLRYNGDPTGITYDSHSIEGTLSGYDIQF